MKSSRKVFAKAKKFAYRLKVLPRILEHLLTKLVAIVTTGTVNMFYAAALQSFTRAVGERLLRYSSFRSMTTTAPTVYRRGSSATGLVRSWAACRCCRRRGEGSADVRVPSVSFNMPLRNRWVMAVCSDESSGAPAMAEMGRARGAMPDALFSASDLKALAALCHELRLAVSEKVMVVGFDDFSWRRGRHRNLRSSTSMVRY